ncbi:enoyl-CoA hydratase EchA19-like isoform X2 [Ostrea edulis]|uniref:enoyl-CoA hydratase EchA19-like isoform X2 n=1 Tax=Ostrea edulis TaxID=37623 RepID=UPI0024AFF41C|nr:enoyl-CoA hydratase EchA19-like isoform X2 [Ostrea edulis]
MNLSRYVRIFCRNRGHQLIRQKTGSRTMSTTVLVDNIGTISLIGLNRPEKRNAVDPPTAEILYRAFKDFEQDENRTVAILYGKGGHFCGGYDLKALSRVDKDILPSAVDPVDSDIGPMGPTRIAFTKPVIAAVSGYAVAGGMELSMMCDLRVLEESAKMGIFCRRFGVPLTDGGTVRLPRLVGLSRALDLILTGREIGAREAYEFGLANRVVPDGTSLDVAIELAETLSRFPQKCMNADRASAYYGMYDAKSRIDALQNEFTQGNKLTAEEAIPGAKKFAEGLGKHGNFDIGDHSGRKSKL